MSQREADEGLDFGALRRAIERRDPDLVLGFYAEDARLSIVDARAVQGSRPFELRGRAEIAKHLRAVYGQRASHRVREATVGEDVVTFREACHYPDGGRIVVETTQKVREGKIVRQVDVVASDPSSDREEEIVRGPPAREDRSQTGRGRTRLRRPPGADGAT